MATARTGTGRPLRSGGVGGGARRLAVAHPAAVGPADDPLELRAFEVPMPLEVARHLRDALGARRFADYVHALSQPPAVTPPPRAVPARRRRRPRRALDRAEGGAGPPASGSEGKRGGGRW